MANAGTQTTIRLAAIIVEKGVPANRLRLPANCGIRKSGREHHVVRRGATGDCQLLQTGAIVEVVHPFIGFEERHEFNKLVRDRVPELIRERGERVTVAQLDEEAFVRALREKLVEEAYELLDTRDFAAVMAELA